MGYLMANNITINGVDGADNEFLHMLESTKNDAVNNDDNGIAQEDTSYTETDDGIIKKINVTEEEVNNLPEKEAVMAAQMIADNMDYSEDDIYLERYQKELEQIQPVSDTTRAYLLINIVEDNDKIEKICTSLCRKFTDDEKYIEGEYTRAGARVLG